MSTQENGVFTIQDTLVYPEKIYWVSEVHDWDNYQVGDTKMLTGFKIKNIDGNYQYFYWHRRANKREDRVHSFNEQMTVFVNKIIDYLENNSEVLKYYLGANNVSQKDITIFAKYCRIILTYGNVDLHPEEMLGFSSDLTGESRHQFNVEQYYKNDETLIKSAHELYEEFKSQLPFIAHKDIEEENREFVHQVHAKLMDLWRPNWYTIPLDKFE